MRLTQIRYSTSKKSTLGLFFINGKFKCYTLEDTYHEKKIYGETRIPASIYTVELRKEGGFHTKYSKRFGKMHKGMLWIRKVPNFEFIYFHPGNDNDDTLGCVLWGNGSINNLTKDGMITDSVKAYKRIYPIIARALEKKESVTYQIINYA